MQLTLRACLLEQRQFKVGTLLTVVEPVALKREDGAMTDTFGHDERLMIISSDDIACIVKSPRTGKRYTTTHRILDRVCAAPSSEPVKGKPVPATLRGKRMY